MQNNNNKSAAVIALIARAEALRKVGAISAAQVWEDKAARLERVEFAARQSEKRQ